LGLEEAMGKGRPQASHHHIMLAGSAINKVRLIDFCSENCIKVT
jgi:hypothetical protein